MDFLVATKDAIILLKFLALLSGVHTLIVSCGTEMQIILAHGIFGSGVMFFLQSRVSNKAFASRWTMHHHTHLRILICHHHSAVVLTKDKPYAYGRKCIIYLFLVDTKPNIYILHFISF